MSQQPTRVCPMEKRSSWKGSAGRLNTQVPSPKMKHTRTKYFPFQSEDSSSLQSIGFALLESALPCSTSPSLASTASPSAFAKLLVSTSPWSVLRDKNSLKLKPQQVGLLMGVSSLLGFLGSVAFPLLRAKLGTPFTALIGALTP